MFGAWARLAITLLVAPAAAAPLETDSARIEKEAKLLFETISQEIAARQSVGTCGLADEWSEPLPDDAARKELGLGGRAPIPHASHIAKPADIFGAHVPNDAFCDDAALRDYVKGRIEAWQSASKAAPARRRHLPPYELTVRSFSFPSFDPALQRAVIVWRYATYVIEPDQLGVLAPVGTISGAATVIYALGPQGWRRTVKPRPSTEE